MVDAQGNPVYEEEPSIIDESWNMAESNQTSTAPPAKAKKGKGTAKKGALPYTVVADREGNIQQRYNGGVVKEDLDEVLEKLTRNG